MTASWPSCHCMLKRGQESEKGSEKSNESETALYGSEQCMKTCSQYERGQHACASVLCAAEFSYGIRVTRARRETEQAFGDLTILLGSVVRMRALHTRGIRASQAANHTLMSGYIMDYISEKTLQPPTIPSPCM